MGGTCSSFEESKVQATTTKQTGPTLDEGTAQERIRAYLRGDGRVFDYAVFGAAQARRMKPPITHGENIATSPVTPGETVPVDPLEPASSECHSSEDTVPYQENQWQEPVKLNFAPVTDIAADTLPSTSKTQQDLEEDAAAAFRRAAEETTTGIPKLTREQRSIATEGVSWREECRVQGTEEERKLFSLIQARNSKAMRNAEQSPNTHDDDEVCVVKCESQQSVKR